MKNKLNLSHHVKLFLLTAVAFAIVLYAMPASGVTAVSSESNTAKQTDLNHPSPPTITKGSLPTDNANNELANCRYGVNALNTWQSSAQLEVIPELGAGWYVTFEITTPDPEPSNGAELVRMIHVNQDKDANDNYLQTYTTRPLMDANFGNYISQFPGSIWVVGNEIERIGQGEIHADLYAEAYHEIYHFIKANDPTALVAIAALVEYTPGRMQYLDMLWQAYQDKYGVTMPVDVWTFHLYILPEVESDGITPNNIASVALGTDPSLGKRVNSGPASCADDDVYCFAEHDDMGIFAEQVMTLRQWMKEHGQRNKPLILTEYSVLYLYILDPGSCYLQDEFGNCFTQERVSSFMLDTFNYFKTAQDPEIGYPLDNNRLVQQAAWYSVYTDPDREGMASNLYEENITTQTLVGTTMTNYVSSEPTYKDLIVESADNAIVFTGNNDIATADLTASFRNRGNVAVESTFTVTFYADAALTEPIDAVTISSDVAGCAVKNMTASVEWSDLTPGLHPYWVFIDSGEVIQEVPGSNFNNVKQGWVYVDPNQVFMPTIFID